ncbi:MAG: hypothetical protein GY827_00375 [Cytophagales bacterium]|nr:hypothetical protein [Cytophagales bacterium]
MEINTLTINHLEFGEETFQIGESSYNVVQIELDEEEEEQGIELWKFTLSVRTSKALKRSKELEEVANVNPNFEVTVLLKSNALVQGQKLVQEKGYDYDRDEHLSNIYYFGHDSVENVEVELLEIQKEWICINVKGKATINNYASNEPDAELSVEGVKFFLDKELERDVC